MTLQPENARSAGLSWVNGPEQPALRQDTVGQILDTAARRWPDADALVSVHQGVRWSFATLAERVERFAAGLAALGFEPGDRLGIWATNCLEWTVTQFAAARAGLILVTVNPAYRVGEIEYLLNTVGMKALVVRESFRGSDYPAMLESLAPEIPHSGTGELRCARLPSLRRLIKIGPDARPGFTRFDDVYTLADDIHLRRVADRQATLQADDPINIQFTSGTTGSPKGATLTHRNIVNNGFFVGRAIGLTAGDRLCIPVPLYHCFGMVMGNLGCVIHGAAMVYPSDSFSAEAVLEAVQSERCSALYGVPTMFIAELEHPQFGGFDLRSLRTGIMAGAPCPVEVMRRVMERMHMRHITIAYGMTETSPVSFQSATDDPIERRVSTVGRVQPHLEAKLVGSDGEVVPRGEPGELWVRGYSVMTGYWNDPEKTREACGGGWMRTGDLAVLDAAGYCSIVGRNKDMIIRGGENIYPRELEEFLYRHESIEEVQVVGVPDEKYGEEVCAVIKLRAGHCLDEEAVRLLCRGSVAHFKVPRYVRFVDGFPTTVTGKIQKYLLREQMIRESNLLGGC